MRRIASKPIEVNVSVEKDILIKISYMKLVEREDFTTMSSAVAWRR